MRSLACCLALVVLAFAAPARAQDPVPTANRTRYSNFLGASGLLYTPSAHTFSEGDWAAHLHGNADFWGGGLLAGVTDRLELGVTALDMDNDRDSFFNRSGGRVLANGKFNLVRERDALPAFSVGVIDAFAQLKGDPSWYLVASKYFTRGETEQDFALVGHLGYGDGIFREQVFVGTEAVFNRNYSLMAELQGGKLNVGARARYGGFAGTAGLFHGKQLGAGVSYTTRF